MASYRNTVPLRTYERLEVEVWASNRTVIRHARRMLDKKMLRPEFKEARHMFYRGLLEHHTHALSLFNLVRWGG